MMLPTYLKKFKKIEAHFPRLQNAIQNWKSNVKAIKKAGKYYMMICDKFFIFQNAELFVSKDRNV